MTTPTVLPLMYTEIADWFPILTAPADYAEEAEVYRRLLQQYAPSPIHSLLELGSGGGHNASYLKQHFQLTLVDLSPDMLAVSRRLNPECDHLQGDMRYLRLGRQFDAVFIHDAIMYMTSVEDLAQAIATAYAHCRPGGVALFMPDCTRESFEPTTQHGGHDAADGARGLRYLEWSWDPDPHDSHFIAEYVYLLREGERVRALYDRHICGVFSQATWEQQLRAAGFQPFSEAISLSDEPRPYLAFIGLKPAVSPAP